MFVLDDLEPDPAVDGDRRRVGPLDVQLDGLPFGRCGRRGDLFAEFGPDPAVVELGVDEDGHLRLGGLDRRVDDVADQSVRAFGDDIVALREQPLDPRPALVVDRGLSARS